RRLTGTLRHESIAPTRSFTPSSSVAHSHCVPHFPNDPRHAEHHAVPRRGRVIDPRHVVPALEIVLALHGLPPAPTVGVAPRPAHGSHVMLSVGTAARVCGRPPGQNVARHSTAPLSRTIKSNSSDASRSQIRETISHG